MDHELASKRDDIIASYLETHFVLSFPSLKSHLVSFFRDTFTVFFISHYFSHHQSSAGDFFYFFQIYGHNLLQQDNYFSTLLCYHVERVNALAILYKEKDHRIIDMRIMGDMHGGHATKVLLTYIGGEQCIATLHVGRAENFLVDFLSTFAPHLTNTVLRRDIDHAIYRRDFVTPQINTIYDRDIDSYYYTLGSVLPYILVVRGIDINQENVIAQVPNVYFPDTECLFMPHLDMDELYSYMLTGYLDDDRSNNASLLLGGLVPRKSYLVPVIVGASKQPYICWTVASQANYYNIPSCQGKISSIFNHQEVFFSGYQESVNSISEYRTHIEEYICSQQINTRVLLRPTAFYRAKYMRAMMNYTLFSISWQESLELGLAEPVVVQGSFTNLIAHETSMLLNGLIPSYYTITTEPIIYNEDHIAVGVLPESQRTSWQHFFKDIDAFLINHQLALTHKLNELAPFFIAK